MTDPILEGLLARKDEKYADFQAKLVPTLPREAFIGVRAPVIRAYAKELKEVPETAAFLAKLPHAYYDEDQLHGALISLIRPYGACLEAVEAFLPYVDNWAVCDSLKPAVFAKNKADLIERIRVWTASDRVYTCRFGMEMLMNFFLDVDFRPEYLALPAAVQSEEYYVQMMQAWFYATALAKQWDAALPYLAEKRLSLWVHNKTIQKACESYRITEEQKAFLRTLRRRKEKT